jgi:hypothetical protein
MCHGTSNKIPPPWLTSVETFSSPLSVLKGDCWTISIQSKGQKRKSVTCIVGYVDDLIVVDRSNQNHVSKQIMECIQKYWKVCNEETWTRHRGVHFTRDTNGRWIVDNSPSITQTKEKSDQYPLPTSPNIPIPTDCHVMSSLRLGWLHSQLWTSNYSVTSTTRTLLEYWLVWTVSTLRFDVTYHIFVLV